VTRVVVSTTSDEFVRRVRLAFGAGSVEVLTVAPGKQRRDGDSDLTGRIGDPTSVMVQLGAVGMPEVLVFGPGVPTDTAFAVAAFIDERHPGTSVVLASGIGPDEWLAAMRLGIRDVAAPDADVADLRVVLERAASTASARQRAVSPADGGRLRGRVIPVASPKGGSGKTTIASNLAVGLARLAPQQTVIVDLDLQFGDVATALQLAPEHGVADAVRVKDLDAMALKTFLSPHQTGLYALCAPDSPAGADAITGEDVSRLIELLAMEFRYVVVDTAPGLTEHTLAVLDQASDAVLVAGMDVPSIRGLRKELEILRELSLTGMSHHVVVNFADRSTGLTLDDVEVVIGTGVDLVLPRSKAVPLSTNRGVPLLQSGARDPVAKELQRLVGRFQPQLKKSTGREARHRALTAGR
jgi:pilus assembly protein CpaE